MALLAIWFGTDLCTFSGRYATVGKLGMRAVLDALQLSARGLSASAAFGANGINAELQMTRADLAAELLGETEPSRARGAVSTAAAGDSSSSSSGTDSDSDLDRDRDAGMAAYRHGAAASTSL